LIKKGKGSKGQLTTEYTKRQLQKRNPPFFSFLQALRTNITTPYPLECPIGSYLTFPSNKVLSLKIL